jgi:hypothetical protein
MAKKYRVIQKFQKECEITIPELLDAECRNAGGYGSGHIESLQSSHEKLKDIVGNLFEALVEKQVLTPKEAADLISYGVEEIEPIN